MADLFQAVSSRLIIIICTLYLNIKFSSDFNILKYRMCVIEAYLLYRRQFNYVSSAALSEAVAAAAAVSAVAPEEEEKNICIIFPA
jgi:hypothetical protein